MSDVTILLEHEGRMVELTVMSLAQARQKIGIVWPALFEEGAEREAAAFEVVMTEVADRLEART